MNQSDNRFYREPGIGDNQPPVDYNDPDILQARLEREYADMLARFAELELGAAKVPTKINTDSEARSVVDWVAQQCKTLITQAERAHTKEKAPYLAGGRTVDRFFNDRIKRLNNTIGPIQRRVQTYFDLKKAEIRRREDAERREAERRRQVALEEAQRLAAEAAAREQLGDGASFFCIADEGWQGGPPLTFTLGPEHQVVYTDRSIRLIYKEKEQVTNLLPSPDVVYQLVKYTPLTVTRPIAAKRHFLQSFMWARDPAARPVSWKSISPFPP